jgi:hypothetical protein
LDPVKFEILGSLRDIDTIAVNKSIRSRVKLKRRFGTGRWRKMKGTAVIRYFDGRVVDAELHWYEAHGVGRFGWKVKRELRQL